jgi:hypothetical protein
VAAAAAPATARRAVAVCVHPPTTEGGLPREVLPWSPGPLRVMYLIVLGQSSPVPVRMLP